MKTQLLHVKCLWKVKWGHPPLFVTCEKKLSLQFVEYWIEFRMKQTKMYVCTLVEFILVDIWIYCCTKSKVEVNNIGRMLVYIHSQQRIEKCESCS